ncbi:MAG: tyrosine-type recombinase/integrase [Acidobacteriia bacterium]|nr:tyrosine-type recombinase/integrase [Terriglobia bacterium]
MTSAEKEQKAEIITRVSACALHHRLATRLLEDGSETCAVQELLGHRDVKTTIRRGPTHALDRGGKGVKSLVDTL